MGIQHRSQKSAFVFWSVFPKSQFHHMKLPFYDAQIPFPKTPQPLLIGGWEDIRSNRVFHQSQPVLRFIVRENEKLAVVLRVRRRDSGFYNKSTLNTPMHNAKAAACLYVLMICSVQNEMSCRKRSLSPHSCYQSFLLFVCVNAKESRALNKNSYLDQQT